MNLNSLPTDCLVAIFTRLPVESMLSLETVCRGWIEPLAFARQKVKRLSLLGSDKMYRHSSTMCPLYLLQLAHQQYSLAIHSSHYHLTLRGDSHLTPEVVHFLLNTFPNVTHLELIQLNLERNLSAISTLLAGLTLTSFSLFHEASQSYTYWEHASTPYSLGRHPRTWAREHLGALMNAPKRILGFLDLQHQPKLERLTLVDLTMYSFGSRGRLELIQLPEFSHLVELHLVRPFDCNGLVGQMLRFTEPWCGLRRLTIETKRIDIGNHLLQAGQLDDVSETFHGLTHLMINAMFNSIIPQIIHPYCVNGALTYLHLHDIRCRLPELLSTLLPLDRLRHLRVNNDFTYVNSFWTAAEEEEEGGGAPPLPVLPSIETLQLDNCDVIHNATEAVPLLRTTFPNLTQLIIERDSRQLGTTCLRCHEAGLLLAQLCMRNFGRILTGRLRGVGKLTKLKKVKVQVKMLFVGEEAMLEPPEWLDRYQVWDAEKEEWSMEVKEF